MAVTPDWLPPLLKETDNPGELGLAGLARSAYERDFHASRPRLGGVPVIGPRGLFDHLTTKESADGTRHPQTSRIARIPWIRAVIEHASDPAVSIWRRRHGRRDRVCLWLERLDYLVVLEDRGDRCHLVTAHVVDNNNTRRDLRKQRGEFRKRHAPP